MDSRHRTTSIAGLTGTADPWSGGPDWLARFSRACARWSARSRERRALARLDDRLLEDIGLTRRQAEAEAAKPPWE